MPVSIGVRLVDAVGQAIVGGGQWEWRLSDAGKPVAAGSLQRFDAATLAATGPVTAWTQLDLAIRPARYAPVSLAVSASATGTYRSDPLVRVTAIDTSKIELRLPLLRLRHCPDTPEPADPKEGSSWPGAWLRRVPRSTVSVYRELLAASMLGKSRVINVRDVPDRPKRVLGDAEDPHWGRFNTRGRDGVTPAEVGAALLLEYGEVGEAASAGPRYLVSVWAPRWLKTSPPTYRDMVGLFHPSTAKTWYPPVAFPYRGLYPYGAWTNHPVPPSDPDRLFQPYVNLALKYPLEWSLFHYAGTELVVVMPVFPHPMPGGGGKPSRDELDYGLPFRQPRAFARLLAEVNLFLLRLRYGDTDLEQNEWWGNARTAAPRSSPIEPPHPELRRVAAACYSASSLQFHALLGDAAWTDGRHDASAWGVPDATLSAFQAAWQENWCLDPLTNDTTVKAKDFESRLIAWLDARSDRRFLMAISGTTTGGDPAARFPALSARSTVAREQSKDGQRQAQVWIEKSGKGLLVYCNNSYLSAATSDTSSFPPFVANPDDDQAHGFMFRLASGLVHGWTRLGPPPP